MRFLTSEEVESNFRGKRVAVVGSAPSVTSNRDGFIDSHDVVVRVNNYKLVPGAGRRTDAHYSFYGRSILKSSAELKHDGVRLCICKCPNSKPIDSPWHRASGRIYGVDFTHIYANRKPFWFCDTFIPDDERFVTKFKLLKKRVPTTGFSAILDLLSWKPAELYITGFDFFTSGLHNVNERWRRGNPSDPIGHDPIGELEWLIKNKNVHPMTFDGKIYNMIVEREGIYDAAN